MKHSNIETVKLDIDEKNIDFALAKRLSEELASTIIQYPMLIAWFDGKKNEEHPSVPECQHKPGWLAYADGHGGRIRVDINENEYSFIFADAGVE
ncbi:MAG: AF1514 family protein [Thiohalomonadales bacterium]